MKMRKTCYVALACFALPTFAQVGSPTVISYLHIENDGNMTLVTPEAGNVTPTANECIFLVNHWHRAFGDTDLSGIDTPTWATQAWTQAVLTPEPGYGTTDNEVFVSIHWTIATASPSADNVTMTFVNGFGPGEWSGGALVEYADCDTSNPIRQSAEHGAASLAGGTALTEAFGMAPLSTSQMLMVMKCRDEAFWGLADAHTGWSKLGDVSMGQGEEGGTQTSYIAGVAGSNANAGTYGGDCGDTSPTHDMPAGAAIAGIEIQATAAAPTLLLRRRRN
jgi:hypothetical protein